MNRIRLILATLILLPLALAAQNVTTPYSMYGYGVIGDHATSMQRQMGGVGYAMNSGRQVNVMNPASYASIDSLTFLFDMGADVSFINRSEQEKKQNSIGGGIGYLTMQFPITKYLGASLGLLPYTSVGYAFGDKIQHGAMDNQGDGGINQLYFGLSGKVKGFSLGFNISYDFGNIANDLFTTTNQGAQTKFEHIMEVRDWNITVGAQYTARWNQRNKLTLGVTYSPKKTLLGHTWCTNQLASENATPDTVAYASMKDRYFQPHSVGFGVSYTYERTSRIMVEADLTWQQWSKAKFSPLYSDNPKRPDDVVFQGMNFNDRTRLAVGAEYVPKIRGNFAQRLTYRIGTYFGQDYINIRGNKVRDLGVSCGFGMPVVEGKTMINLGFEWKHRSASPQKLITENYFNIMLGINFNESWFWQRKIR